MNDEWLDQVEQHLAKQRPRGAPAELRSVVLARTRRELASAKWDGRLWRAAAVLLVTGIGLNALVGWNDDGAVAEQAGPGPSPHAIAEVVVAVSDMSSPEAHGRLARQLAAWSSWTLSPSEAAAVEQEIERLLPPGVSRQTNDNPKDG